MYLFNPLARLQVSSEERLRAGLENGGFYSVNVRIRVRKIFGCRQQRQLSLFKTTCFFSFLLYPGVGNVGLQL